MRSLTTDFWGHGYDTVPDAVISLAMEMFGIGEQDRGKLEMFFGAYAKAVSQEGDYNAKNHKET